MQIYLDWLWENKYEWESKDGTKRYVMDIKNEKLDHPSLMGNAILEKQLDNFYSPLSSRVRSCLLIQILGMIGASLEKQRKRKYFIDGLTSSNKPVKNSLLKKYNQNKPVKPSLSNVNVQLSSNCVKLICKDDEYFDKWIKLHSLGFSEEIYIPVKMHKNANKFIKNNWTLKNSVLICKDSIRLTWEKETPQKKTDGITVGADQGKKDIITFSNGIVTPKIDSHGHTLDSILLKMSKRKKGSKAFKRASDQRENFINWSINQLNLSEIKQINLEKIWNINFRRNTSRVLRHWTNTIIRDKVMSLCQELGVQVTEQGSTYRSQRCSVCGMVKKSHRKGKNYSCSSCGLKIDADLNAAMNHEQDLPEVPYELRKMERNKNGFLWKSNGFFDLSGTSLESVLAQQ